VYSIHMNLCIVGLGYVGLPLAHAFAKAGHDVSGFDVDETRITELIAGKDRTNELTGKDLKEVKIDLSTDPDVISKSDIVILAIPTPVDRDNKPDLSLVHSATETVGKHMKKDCIVVYESTVYPGVTEEVCGPLLEKISGYKQGEDFRLGYSPERINPGDKEHTVGKIMKVVAGEDKKTTDTLADLYGEVIPAGIHKAKSIRVAEMAKAIENAQRDLNIAYINEIAMLCNKLGIETNDVLDAASTKWNFLPFKPGLVGGHCIGVDPYYLLEGANQLGMEMPLVTTARRINDGMPVYIAERVKEALKSKGKNLRDSSVLVLGLTFKENVPDTRNAKAEDVVICLQQAGCIVGKHDPFVTGVKIEGLKKHDAIVLLVPHDKYIKMSPKDFTEYAKDQCVFYDLKSTFKKSEMEAEGFTYLTL
jgi:UDP-N-acetyl-D-glucosamine/UDP-N-acetyl-D-galactosamine dehydrogenase